MAKIGQTIREIRAIKGLSQKQVYAGIVSRSFANRFENGANDIQAEKFLKILDNLGISPSEFQYINNDYQLSPIEQMLAKINYLYDTHAFQTLATWLQQHKTNHNLQIQIVIGYAEVLLSAYSYHQFSLSKNMRLIVQHLLNEKSWTLQEIKMVNILIPIIATHKQFKISIEAITRRVEQNYQLYLTKYADPFRIYNELLNYYGVVFQNYLNIKDYKAAYDFKSKFLLDENLLDWNARVTQQLWLAIWELYFGSYNNGKSTLEKIIDFKKIFPTSFALNINAIVDIRLKDALTYRHV